MLKTDALPKPLMDLGRYPTFLNVNRPKRKVFKGRENINDSKVFNLRNISNQNQKGKFSQCDKTLHPKFCDNTSTPLLLVLCLLQIVATIAAAPLFNYNLQRRRGGSSANQDCRTKKNVFQGYFMNVYFAEMGAPICSRTNV